MTHESRQEKIMKLVTKLDNLYLTLEDITSHNPSQITSTELRESWQLVAEKKNLSFGYIRKTNTAWLLLQENQLVNLINVWLGGGELTLPSDAFIGAKHQNDLETFNSALENLKPVSRSKEWIESQIKEKALNRRLAAALKKEYKREEYDDLLSHTNYWLMHWADIGQFDEWLKDHDSVKPSVLVEWLKQKMRTEVFARGKDALTRQNTGARTQYEVGRGAVHEQSLQISVDTPDVVLQQGEKEGEFEQHVVSMPVEVNIDPDFRGDFVRDLIRLARPRAADRYVRIFDLMAQDYSLDEIAEIEGVQKHRAAKLTQRVRDDIQQGAITTEVAKRILQEISDEPYSTRDDLLDVIPGDKKDSFGAALEILSYRKMISENKQGCFLATKEGEFSLYSGELF